MLWPEPSAWAAQGREWREQEGSLEAAAFGPRPGGGAGRGPPDPGNSTFKTRKGCMSWETQKPPSEKLREAAWLSEDLQSVRQV